MRELRYAADRGDFVHDLNAASRSGGRANAIIVRSEYNSTRKEKTALNTPDGMFRFNDARNIEAMTIGIRRPNFYSDLKSLTEQEQPQAFGTAQQCRGTLTALAECRSHFR